jgi:hypothetical protein
MMDEPPEVPRTKIGIVARAEDMRVPHFVDHLEYRSGVSAAHVGQRGEIIGRQLVDKFACPAAADLKLAGDHFADHIQPSHFSRWLSMKKDTFVHKRIAYRGYPAGGTKSLVTQRRLIIASS